MAFCVNCGKEIEQGASFCTNCGKPIHGTPEIRQDRIRRHNEVIDWGRTTIKRTEKRVVGTAITYALEGYIGCPCFLIGFPVVVLNIVLILTGRPIIQLFESLGLTLVPILYIVFFYLRHVKKHRMKNFWIAFAHMFHCGIIAGVNFIIIFFLVLLIFFIRIPLLPYKRMVLEDNEIYTPISLSDLDDYLIV